MSSTALELDKEIKNKLENRPSLFSLVHPTSEEMDITTEIYEPNPTRMVFSDVIPDRRPERKDVKQTFEGVVISVDRENEEFTAEIRDLTNKKNPKELVTLLIEDVMENEQDLLSQGGIFNWYLGMIVERNYIKTKEPYSKIRFRRFLDRTDCEFVAAQEYATEFLSHFEDLTS